MLTLKERFAQLQAEKPEITQADLARATGAKPPSVNAWFTGETKSMKPETAEIAASMYGVNALWLATGKGNKRGKFTGIEDFGDGMFPYRSDVRLPIAPANPDTAIPGQLPIETLMAGLSAYLMQMDHDARDDAGDVLRKLATKPENHARAAAMFAAAFQQRRRKAA